MEKESLEDVIIGSMADINQKLVFSPDPTLSGRHMWAGHKTREDLGTRLHTLPR